MSDEHHHNLMGVAGNDVIRTKNLDRLADRGILFENCYTPSPICVPARLSVTAGQYVSRCGAWSNESKLASDEIPSLASVMKNTGYDCYLGGKMHYAKDRRYGFDELYTCWTNTNERKAMKARISVDEHNASREVLSGRFDDFYIGDENQVYGHDEEVTEACTDFLKKRKEEDGPFLLIAGYLAPHFPLIVKEEYYRKYQGKVDGPVIPRGHLQEQPLHYQIMNKAFGNTLAEDGLTLFGRELYYGLVEWFDDEVGKLLDVLEDSAVADNTIVIYTSDHGENMGEHGFWWKNTMYDDSAKVPLIVSWPKVWDQGERRSEVCSLLDVIQTICEVGQAQVPSDWDGDSLIPLIEDRCSDWKDMAVSEYYAHNIAAGHSMIRHGRFKYVYFNRIDEEHPSDCQLFDMLEDPGEFNDLSREAKYSEMIVTLHRMLTEELGCDPELAEVRSRMAISESALL